MGNSAKTIEEFKGIMTRQLEMTNLGSIKYFLRFEQVQMTTSNPISTSMEPGTKLSKFDRTH